MTKAEEWNEEAVKYGDAIRAALKELEAARGKRDEFWNQLPKDSIRRHVLAEYVRARSEGRPCPRLWWGLDGSLEENEQFFKELDDLGITEVWYWQGRWSGASNLRRLETRMERTTAAFIRRGWEKIGETDSYCICGNETSTYDIWRKKEEEGQI